MAVLVAATATTTGCVQTGEAGSALDAAQGVVAQSAEFLSEQLVLRVVENGDTPITPHELLERNAVYYVALIPSEQTELVSESNAGVTLYGFATNGDEVTASVYLP